MHFIVEGVCYKDNDCTKSQYCDSHNGYTGTCKGKNDHPFLIPLPAIEVLNWPAVFS